MMHGRAKPTPEEAKLYREIIKTARAFLRKWEPLHEQIYHMRNRKDLQGYKRLYTLICRCQYGRYTGTAAINEAKKDAEFFAKALRKVD